MSENVSRRSHASRGIGLGDISPLSPVRMKGLDKGVRFRPEDVGLLRDKLISAEFEGEDAWITIDPIEIAYFLGWDITNRHIAFEQIIARIGLQKDSTTRDYKKEGEKYLLSFDSGVNKMITFLTALLNQNLPLSQEVKNATQRIMIKQ